MKNIFAVLAATAAVSLATSSYAADESTKTKSSIDYKKDGGYEAKTKSETTTASGTSKSTETKTDVDVDSDGTVDKTVKKESETDPKGLMNKQEDTSKTEIEEKDNGGYKQTTVRKHKDAAGTDVYYKTVTDVDVDSNGNVTSTAKTEKTTDPEGLWNKTKSTSKTKTVNGKVIEHTEKNK